jgi:hypothetical protein
MRVSKREGEGKREERRGRERCSPVRGEEERERGYIIYIYI